MLDTSQAPQDTPETPTNTTPDTTSQDTINAPAETPTNTPETPAENAPESAPENASTAPELTFGQKAVGLNFNPSNNPEVQKLKELYAEIIDLLVPSGDINNGAADLQGRFVGRAVNDAVAAQMWAVKAVTFAQ